jgi:membrane-bound metal-dependent hydrolase YbcI (DUF457 family)
VNGRAHRLLGAGTWLYAGAVFAFAPWQVALGVPVAMVFSAGRLSCDIDNTKTWKKLDRIVPDEWLGEGGPLGHRQVLHWWGLPAVAALLVWLTQRDQSLAFAAWAAITGWSSHLAGDFFCGQAGFGTRKGVPLGPWWWHVGVGFKSGGWAERLLVPAAFITVLWLLANGHYPQLPADLPWI